jgi:hypothetical protein
MEALWMTRTGIPSARARRKRSVCVVALRGGGASAVQREGGRAARTHPNGSPTTRKATSDVRAGSRMVSASLSTVSRCAREMRVPYAASCAGERREGR